MIISRPRLRGLPWGSWPQVPKIEGTLTPFNPKLKTPSLLLLLLLLLLFIIIGYLFSHAIKLLGPIWTVTFSFSSLDSLMMLYSSLVRSKHEYDSVLWISLTNTDSNNLESIQKNIFTLCHNSFFKNHNVYTYSNVLENWKLHTLYERWHYFNYNW
jgi:hypothetical protein